MGAEGAVNVLYRRELDKAADPAAERQTKIHEYQELFANPYKAAELGYLDAVIDPADTRRLVHRCLEMLKGKREKGPARKHGNIPL
jgi:propionyl-CoA carboxylase beta chain